MNYKLLTLIAIFLATFATPVVAQEFTLTDSTDQSAEISWPVVEKPKTSISLNEAATESNEIIENEPTFVSVEVSEIPVTSVSVENVEEIEEAPVAAKPEETEEAPAVVSDDVNVLEVQSKQVTFLTADNAELISSDERVAIIAENVDAKKSYGVMLKITNQSHDWIEVHTKSKPFPPRILDPFKEDVYLLVGDPGETFFISVRSNDDRPTWIEVQIEGDGSESGGIIGKWAKLQQISKMEADKINDPSTRSLLAKAYSDALVSVDNMTLSDAKKNVVKARKAALSARTTFESNWFVYLQKVGDEADKAEDTADYKAAISAIIAGLSPPATAGVQGTSINTVSEDIVENVIWSTDLGIIQGTPIYVEPPQLYQNNPVLINNVDCVGCKNGRRIIGNANIRTFRR